MNMVPLLSHFSLPTGLTFVLVPLLGVAAPAQEKYSIGMDLPPGSSWTFQRSQNTQRGRQGSMDGRVLNQSQEDVTLRLSGAVTVLESSKGLPTVLRVTLDPDCQFAKQSSGSPGNPGQSKTVPFGGQTLIVRRFGETIVHDGKLVLPPEVLSELRSLTGHDPTAYPPKPVAVGEEWSVPAEQLAQVLNLNPQNDRAVMNGRLADVQESGGRKTAVIRFTGQIQRRQPDGTILGGQFTVDQTVDVASGQLLAQDTQYQDRSILQTAGFATVTQTTLHSSTRLKITDDPQAIAACAKRPAALSKRQGTVRFTRAVIRDTDLGMDALSLLIPMGWSCEGKVIWRTHPEKPASIPVLISNPKGTEQMAVYPILIFEDGVRENAAAIAAVAGPGAVASAQEHYPEGGSYMYNEVRRVVADPVQFLQQFMIPRFRPDLAEAKIVAVADAPWAAAFLGHAYPSQQNIDLHAARIRLEYLKGGTEMQEDFFLAMSFAPILERELIWQPDLAYSMRAEKGKLEDAAAIFQVVLCSARTDLKWYNRERQAAANVTASIKRSLQASMKMSQIIHETSEEISAGIHASYEKRQAVLDRTATEFCRAIRSVEVYDNPFDQHPVELPSGYNHVWTNPRGEYLLTDNPNLDPIIGDNLDWKRLERPRE
jgi:hypothetical protein